MQYLCLQMINFKNENYQKYILENLKTYVVVEIIVI